MTEDPAFGVARAAVLGHEFAGEVVALGKGSRRRQAGRSPLGDPAGKLPPVRN